MLGFLVVHKEHGALCGVNEFYTSWTGLGCNPDTTAAFFETYEEAGLISELLQDPNVSVFGPIYQDSEVTDKIPVSIVESLGIKCSYYRQEPENKLPWPW